MSWGIFRKVWAVSRLDLSVWLRSPWAIAAAVVPPLAMAGLLAVLSLAVGRQPVALVVQDQGPAAQKMQKIITSDHDAYIVKTTSNDYAAAQKLLKQQQIVAIITIPADFDQAAARHKATVKLTLNNIDIDFADDIRRAVDLSVANFNSPLFGEAGPTQPINNGSTLIKIQSPKSAANGKGDNDGDEDDLVSYVIVENPAVQQKLDPYRVAFNAKNARQTDVKFLRYQVLPAFILLILNIGIFGAAMLIARDFERGTAKLYRLAVSPATVLAGRLLSGLIAIAAITVPLTALAVADKLIRPPSGHWPYLIEIFGLTAVMASGLGCLLGFILRKSDLTAIGTVIAATYLFFLGGGFTTLAFLPNWIQLISRFIPASYAISGLRQALFYDDLGEILLDIAWLAVFAAGAILVGYWAIRRSFNKAEPKNINVE